MGFDLRLWSVTGSESKKNYLRKWTFIILSSKVVQNHNLIFSCGSISMIDLFPFIFAYSLLPHRYVFWACYSDIFRNENVTTDYKNMFSPAMYAEVRTGSPEKTPGFFWFYSQRTGIIFFFMFNIHRIFFIHWNFIDRSSAVKFVRSRKTFCSFAASYWQLTEDSVYLTYRIYQKQWGTRHDRLKVQMTNS